MISVTGISPTRLTGDGTTLYTMSGSSFYRIDVTTGAVSSIGNSVSIGSVNSLAAEAADEILVADPVGARIWRVDASAPFNTVASAGLLGPQLVAGGPRDLLATTQCVAAPSGGYVGAIFQLPDEGPVRLLDTGHCAAAIAHEGATAVFIDFQSHEVERIDLGSRTVTTLASPADGLVFPIGVATAPDGTVFVTDQVPNAIAVRTIAPDGTIDLAFGGGTSMTGWGGAISGNQFFLSGQDAQGGGIFAMPLAGGEVVRLTSPADSPFTSVSPPNGVMGTLAPDGSGGVYLADLRANRLVTDVGADGSVALVQTAFDERCDGSAVAVDPASGNLRLANSSDTLRRPIFEMLP